MHHLRIAPAILLCGESVGYCVHCCYLGRCCLHTIEASVLDVEGFVFNAKGGIVRGGTSVFAQAKQVKEGDNDHIRNGHSSLIPFLTKRLGQDENDDDYWDRFDLFRGRVFLLVRTYLATNSEVDVPMDILTDIWGPQSGECLTDCAHGVLHRASSDGVATERKSAIVISLAKYLEEGAGSSQRRR
jgi:hypothetical protein